MRIAMLTNNYKPYIGGVPVSIAHLAAGLRRLGHTVYIFAPSYPNQLEEPYVIRYPSFPIQIAGAPIPNVLAGMCCNKQSAHSFYQMTKDLQLDLIHVHHPAITGNVALMLRRQLGIPVVFTYHTRYEAYLHYIKAFKLLERCTGIFHKYLEYFCNQCDMVLAPTLDIKEHLLYEKSVQAPIEVLPTGLPQENFSIEEKETAQIRNQYREKADYLFCTVARLAKEKNLDFLLDSLQQLKKRLSCEGKAFRHLMIGEGPEYKHLQEKCRKLGLVQEVLFIGNIENTQMKNYLAACDLFLFTSKSETQGIVVLEAMAAGTPVVALDAAGVRTIVHTNENGILTAEDTNCFSLAAAQALHNPEFYETLCKGAKKTAEEYAEEKVARCAERYYCTLLRNYTERTLQRQTCVEKRYFAAAHRL